MYNVLSIIGKLKGRWLTLEIEDVPLKDIIAKYDDVRIQMTRLTDNKFVEYHLKNVLDVVKSVELDAVRYIQSLGNINLTVTIGFTSLEVKGTSRAADLWDSGFNVAPVIYGTHVDTEHGFFATTDLLITHPSIDMEKLSKHCLFSINGLIKRHVLSNDGISLLDVKPKENGFVNNTGTVLNFEDVGELKTYDIDVKSLGYPKGVEYNHRDGSYIKLPPEVQGKTLMLVFGGYLYPHDTDVLTHIGNNIYRISMPKIDVCGHFLDSKDDLDLSDMNVVKTHVGDTVSVQHLLDDNNLEKYLFNKSTFVVTVDNSNVHSERMELTKTGIQGLYQCKKSDYRHQIAFMESGRVFDYHYTFNRYHNVVNIVGKGEGANHALYKTIDYRHGKWVPNVTEINRYTDEQLCHSYSLNANEGE